MVLPERGSIRNTRYVMSSSGSESELTAQQSTARNQLGLKESAVGC